MAGRQGTELDRDDRGAAVRRRCLQPHLLAARRRPRPDPAAAAERAEGQGRARHGRGSTASRTASPTSFPLVPEMVALCEDESVIGSEFYVMQRIDGIIPRRDFPPGVSLDEEQARALCTNALDVLIDLHRIDVDATPLAAMNKGEGYVERQISGWSQALPQRAHRRHRPTIESSVMAWLAEHQPEDVASCLIHNDFRFDNLVLDRDDPTRPVGCPRLGDGHGRRPADGPRRDARLLGAGRRRRVLPAVPAPAHEPAGDALARRRSWTTTASGWATRSRRSSGASTRSTGCSASG